MLDSLRRYRGYIALTLIYTLGLGGYMLYDRHPQPEPIEIVVPTIAPTMTPTETSTPAPLHIHVIGAVQHPGVYVIEPNSRLIQAIEAAGGLADGADQARINLADLVVDGQQIYVPIVGTPPPPSPTAIRPSPTHAAKPALAPSHGALININTASAAELDTLPGIGPAYAQRIIAYRETSGPFSSPEQVQQVKGIGPVCYERIQNLITTE